MVADSKLWSTHYFDERREVQLDVNELQVRIVRRGSDLLVTEHRNPVVGEVSGDENPEDDFRRYAFEYPVGSVAARPRTPERPLVVRPAHPLLLAPNARVDFFISVPVDLQLSAVLGKKEEPMERLRTIILSDTWFGDQLAGVLCFALMSRARRDRSEIGRLPPGRALCKLQIHNESAEQLNCTKFCLHLDHCHLWLHEEQLWTSPVRVRFHGRDQMSSVDYSADAPSEASGAVRVAEATEDPLSGLIRRTFAFAGLGGIIN